MNTDEKKEKQIKVKIISGDEPYSTRVLDAETGQYIAYVHEVHISIKKYHAFMPQANILFDGTPCDLVAELAHARVTCPHCNKEMVLTDEQVQAHMAAKAKIRSE